MYTGSDTKLYQNKPSTASKTSKFTSFFTKLIIFYIVLAFVNAATDVYVNYEAMTKHINYLFYHESKTAGVAV